MMLTYKEVHWHHITYYTPHNPNLLVVPQTCLRSTGDMAFFSVVNSLQLQLNLRVFEFFLIIFTFISCIADTVYSTLRSCTL